MIYLIMKEEISGSVPMCFFGNKITAEMFLDQVRADRHTYIEARDAYLDSLGVYLHDLHVKEHEAEWIEKVKECDDVLWQTIRPGVEAQQKYGLTRGNLYDKVCQEMGLNLKCPQEYVMPDWHSHNNWFEFYIEPIEQGKFHV